MKKLLGILVVSLLWCGNANAEKIEFKKCWFQKTESILGDVSPSYYKNWDDWNKKSYFEIKLGGVEGSDIPHEDVIFSIDTESGIVTRVTIHTDEFVEGMNIAKRKQFEENFKKWKEGKTEIKPLASYVSKIEKDQYRLLEYSAGHISFDDPEAAIKGAMINATKTFELNISEFDLLPINLHIILLQYLLRFPVRA